MGKNLAIAILGLAVLVLLTMDTGHRNRNQILSDRIARLGKNHRSQSATNQTLEAKEVGEVTKSEGPVKSQPAPIIPSETETPGQEGSIHQPALQRTQEPDLMARARRLAYWQAYPGILDLDEYLDLLPEQESRISELLKARDRDLEALDLRKEELQRQYEGAIRPWLDARQQEVYDFLCSRVNPSDVWVSVGQGQSLTRAVRIFQFNVRDSVRH